MNTNPAFLAGSDALRLKPSLRTRDFDFADLSRRPGDPFQSGSASDRPNSTPRMIGSLRGGLSSLISPVHGQPAAGQVHRHFSSENSFSSLGSAGYEVGSLGSGTQPLHVPPRFRDRASTPLALAATSRPSNPSSSPFSVCRGSLGSSQPLSVPSGLNKFRDLRGPLAARPGTSQRHQSCSSLSSSRSLLGTSLDAPKPIRTLSGAAERSGELVLQRPVRAPPPTSPISRSIGFALSDGASGHVFCAAAAGGALADADVAGLDPSPSPLSTLPRNLFAGGAGNSEHYSCMFQEPEGIADVSCSKRTPELAFLQLPLGNIQSGRGRMKSHLAMQFGGALCLSPVKELASAKPSMNDLACVPSMGELASAKPSMNDLAFVPSMGDLGSVPSMGDLASESSTGGLAVLHVGDVADDRKRAAKMLQAATGVLPGGSLVGKASLGSANEELLSSLRKEHEMFNHELVRRAFSAAASAFDGQVRKNGDPVLLHCVETAVILAQIGADATVVAAGLLHDCLDDTPMTEQQLKEAFGDDVASLVAGVSQMSYLSQRLRDSSGAWSSAESERMQRSGPAMSEAEAERLRNVFLSMADVRVVLIKLADRLHNLRTLAALPREKQRRVASETLELFAPLANRLGIWSWKAEIEDVCFSTLWDEDYDALKAALDGSTKREAVLGAIGKLDAALRGSGIQYHDLHGRSKNLYSIFLKMKNKGKQLSEVFDQRAIRLIVEDEQSCYAALECVRAVWPNEETGHFKDYISAPKGNGYQSLHVVVKDEDGYPLEVQIRTKAMHHAAEFGVAAHWRYKEKKKPAGTASPTSTALPASTAAPAGRQLDGARPQTGLESRASEDEDEEIAAMLRVEWLRYTMSWVAEFTDQKVRLAEGNQQGAAPLPPRQLCRLHMEHAEGCCFAPGAPEVALPALPETEPLLVIVVDGNEKVSVAKLKGGTTREGYLGQYLAARGQLHLMSRARLLVNSKHARVTNESLKVGSVLEVVMDGALSGGVRPLGADDGELLFFDADVAGEGEGDTMPLHHCGSHPELHPGYAAADEKCTLSLEFQRRKLAVAWGDGPVLARQLSEVPERQ